MSHYAILIDGGFAKRKLGTSRSPATAPRFAALVEELKRHPALSDMRLHRVYFYDSAPLELDAERPLQGGKESFGSAPVAGRSKALFSELSKLPFFALRLGELAFNGWRVDLKKLDKAAGTEMIVRATDLRPQIQQKGVDMRIGMDMAALTLKKQAQVIVLVSGDSDFVPAMKFARREGAQLFLVSLGQSVKPSMHEHSDLMLSVDVARLSAL